MSNGQWIMKVKSETANGRRETQDARRKTRNVKRQTEKWITDHVSMTKWLNALLSG